MKKNFGIPVMSLMGILLFTNCGDKKPAATQQGPPPPVAVNVYEVKEGSATYFDEYPGTVIALNEVEIRPQVSGYITGIFFKDGQRVSKGQKLYSIDQQQYQGSYDQALGNLNVAKANLARAQKDADRYTELAKQDAIAKQVLDHAIADVEANKMVVEAAKANLNGVQTNLRYTNISSPISGTIGISQVKLGASVVPGQTWLNTVSADDPLAVDFALDEKEIARFTQLQQKGTKPKDSVFMIQLPGGIVYNMPGSIGLIDRAVDPQTGTIKTRLIFSNKSNMLRAGMSCVVRIKNDGASNKVLLPYRAVIEQMGEYAVFVLGDSSKVTQRKILLGTRINENIVVRDGLKAGDKVVIDGVQKIRDGAVVKVN